MVALSQGNLSEELKIRHKVKLAGVDADGILRGKVMAMEKFLSTVKSGFGFSSAVFGWDMHDALLTSEITTGAATAGHSDIMAVADRNRLYSLKYNLNYSAGHPGSITREITFLFAEEAQGPVKWEFDNENAVVLKNASFTWERSTVRESDIDDVTTKKAVGTAKQKKVDKKVGKQARYDDGEGAPSKVLGKSPSNMTLDEKAIRGEGGEEQAFALEDLNLTVGNT